MDSKAKAEHLDLIKSKIQIDKETNKLISAEDVKSDAFNIAKSLSRNLMTIPAKLAEQLENINNKQEIYKIIEEEIRAKLDDVISELEKGVF